MIRNFKVLMVIMVVFVLVGSSYAFAAANTVEATTGGFGTETVSGYTITNVVYDLDADPTKLVDVSFDIAGTDTPLFVTINLTTVPSWISCSVGVAPNWVCATTMDFADVTVLDVVASSTINP